MKISRVYDERQISFKGTIQRRLIGKSSSWPSRLKARRRNAVCNTEKKITIIERARSCLKACMTQGK